jgi:hypothetical protein
MMAAGNGLGAVAMSDLASNENFEIGRVISRTFSVYGRNFVTFTVLAALAAIPTIALTYYFGKVNPAAVAVAGTPPAHIFATLGAVWGRAAIVGLIGISFAFILQAALIHGTLAELNGKRATFGECLSTGVRIFLPLIGLGILTLLGCYAATLLLIVPGIMLYMAWFVVVPAYVVEHTGVFGAFGRSRELTRGFRWPIFGLAIIYFVAAVAINFAITPLFSVNLFRPDAATFAMPYLLTSAVVRVFVSVIAATGVASVYYELRLAKEGIGPQGVAAAFD